MKVDLPADPGGRGGRRRREGRVIDANGTVLDSTPVVGNLFESDVTVPQGAAAYLATFDAQGNVLSKRALPG